MTLAAVESGLYIPQPQWGGDDTGAGMSTWNITSPATVALVVQVPKTGSLDQAAVSLSAASTPGTGTVRLETLDSSGNPSGTLFHANASGTYTPAAGINIVSFSGSVPVTRGDLFAIVVGNSAGSYNNTINKFSAQFIATGMGGFPGFRHGTPGGSWFRDAKAFFNFGLRYDTPEWAFLGEPIHFPTTYSNDSNFGTGTGATTGTRQGVRFQLPFAAKLRGLWVLGYWNAGGTGNSIFDIILYDDGGTALQTMASSLDPKDFYGTAAAGRLNHFLFSADYDLDAATWYRLAIVPTASATLSLYNATYGSAAYLDALTLGQKMYGTRYISSSWTNETTIRPAMGLRLAGFDAGTGSGSVEHSAVFIG